MPQRAHYRVSAIGTLGPEGNPVEEFSYGLSVARQEGEGGAGGTLDLNDDQALDIATSLIDYHRAGVMGIHPSAILRQVRIASILPSGKYARDPWVVPTGVVRGGGPEGNTLPQAALVVSLETARYGPTGKGRFFLPMPTFALEPDYQISPADAQGVRDRTVQLINEINDEPGFDVLGLGVCIASSKGYNTRVTGVRVGRVIDTLRTRRRSLLEDYNKPRAVAPANPPG